MLVRVAIGVYENRMDEYMAERLVLGAVFQILSTIGIWSLEQ